MSHWCGSGDGLSRSYSITLVQIGENEACVFLYICTNGHGYLKFNLCAYYCIISHVSRYKV